MITLKRQVGKSPISKERIDCKQQEIQWHGKTIGFLADGEGAYALIHDRYDPETLAQMELCLRKLIYPRQIAGIKQLPPPPEQPTRATQDDLT